MTKIKFFNQPLGFVVNYCLLCYAILQMAFSRLILSFDGYGRIPMALVFISIVANIHNKRFRDSFFIGPSLIWIIWCLYVTLTTLYFGNPLADRLDTFGFLFNYVYLPTYCMVITYYETSNRPEYCFNMLIYYFLIYVMLGLLLGTSMSNANGRGSVELGNYLPLTAMTMFVMLVFGYVKRWVTTKKIVIIFFLCVVTIMVVATRKALIGIVIVMFFYVFGRFEVKNPKNILMLAIIGLISYGVFTFIMESTVIGERFSSGEDDSLRWNPNHNPFLSMVGDRAYFYTVGYDIFLKSEQFIGIGLRHFPIEAHTQLPIHSEYMVQLVECGYIGCFLYLLFIISLYRSFTELRQIRGMRLAYLVCIGWLSAFLFIGLTAWTYEFKFYYIVFGFLLGSVSYEKKVYYNENNTCYHIA